MQDMRTLMLIPGLPPEGRAMHQIKMYSVAWLGTMVDPSKQCISSFRNLVVFDL